MGEAPSPVDDLQQMLHVCIYHWLATTMLRVLEHQDVSTDAAAVSVHETADVVSSRLLRDLDRLLETDPDDQRSNPLALIRDALSEPSDVLSHLGAQPVPRDEFARNANPGDIFGMAPATWSDIDERLHEPGLKWGAWKAATILMRRREEGLR